MTKSIKEVSAGIMALKDNRTARQKIEAIEDAKLAESGEAIGGGVFMHETAKKPQTNFSKGSRLVNSIAGVW